MNNDYKLLINTLEMRLLWEFRETFVGKKWEKVGTLMRQKCAIIAMMKLKG